MLIAFQQFIKLFGPEVILLVCVQTESKFSISGSTVNASQSVTNMMCIQSLVSAEEQTERTYASYEVLAVKPVNIAELV